MTEETKCFEHETHTRTGHVTVSEARESLSRFIASHFRDTVRPHARFTIPTECRRDDDMLMSAFICQAERAFKEVERLRELLALANAAVAEVERLRATIADVHVPILEAVANTSESWTIGSVEVRRPGLPPTNLRNEAQAALDDAPVRNTRAARVPKVVSR